MTVDPGYYDQSIPPALLIGGGRRTTVNAPAGGTAVRTAPPAPADQQQPSPPLLATAGAPGVYTPAMKASSRPVNVTALNSGGVIADPPAGWAAGDYVPVGTSGKRAHWTGEEWRGGESPGGYPAANEGPAPRHAAPEVTSGPAEDVPPDAARTPLPPAPYTQFPGDEQPGDLAR